MTDINSIQKEQILEQGFEAISQAGVRSFTVEYLAQKLGMSKKTIYKHFPTKEKLVRKIILYVTGRVAGVFQDVRDQEPNPVLQFIKVMEFFVNMAGHVSLPRMAEFKSRYPDIWKEIEEFRLNRREDFYRMLKAAQDQGLARSDLNMRAVATVYIHIINSTIQPEFFIQNDLPIGDTIRGFVDVVARGIFTAKGIKAIEMYYEQNKN